MRFLYLVCGLLGWAWLMSNGWLIPCPLHRLTGLECPFCGGQRMLIALFQGDWAAACRHNPFLVCSLPLLLVWLTAYLKPSYVEKVSVLRRLCSDRIFFCYLFAALLWGIWRNV